MSEMMKNTNWEAAGAVIGGIITAFSDGLRVLLYPLQGFINLLNLMGVNFGKFVGYGLAAGAFAAKIMLVANAFKMLALASAMLTKTPMGLAIAGVVIGGGLAYEAYMKSSGSSMAASVANRHSSNQQNVKVMVEPNERGFTNLIRTEVVNYEHSDKAALAQAAGG
jgi:hypothetical protein